MPLQKCFKNENRKKKRVWIISVLLVCLFCFLYYCFNIEPYRLVSRTFLVDTKLEDKSNETLRIVLFSDLHLKKDYPAAMLEMVVDEINAQNPDLVIFCGDLYDNYETYHDDKKVIEEFSRIRSKYGKLAVWGNRDYGGGAHDAYLPILDASGFTLLQNSNWYIPLENGKTVLFTGLDDAFLGSPSLPVSTKVYQSDYDVLILHEPDVLDQYAKQGYDLALAGHSHGGQILLPFVDDVSLDLQSEYKNGFYQIAQTLLFVTSGIGSTHISARFLVPPSLHVLDLDL